MVTVKDREWVLLDIARFMDPQLANKSLWYIKGSTQSLATTLTLQKSVMRNYTRELELLLMYSHS